ncbi:MAG: patatin family protein [Lachnospiraceae bacterium]|nr:patatin family protein [Lachnospiraceae bacterium]
MKTGLVMEGGAMRGMFTCGVIDVMLENGLKFDGGIGVSAGAAFGCNYKSKQIGRALRYNKKYCKDKRYGSFYNLIKTGDIYDREFCYKKLPYELDKFDTKVFAENPMEFYVVATDVETGKAVYHKCTDGMQKDIDWIGASASIPMFANVVEIDDYKLLDGGVADSIPVKYFESIGYDRNVVILTQPKGYVKKPMGYTLLMKLLLRKYPNLVESIKNRHLGYNETTGYIEEKEKAGDIFVIRPPEALKIGKMENNPDELERVYQIGRKEAQKHLEAIRQFLSVSGKE